jgi:L-asparaginase
VETFRSLEFGQLGLVGEDGVRFYRAPLRRQTIPIGSEMDLGRVEIIMNYAGADGLLIRCLMDAGDVNGLVIAGLGLGSVSSSMYDAIQEARIKDVPVVISTRVPTGRIFSLSAMKGASLTLKQIGCVLADNLSPQKARVLLMLALTKTRDPAGLKKYFDT